MSCLRGPTSEAPTPRTQSAVKIRRLAAPVFGADGTARAAMAVVLPIERSGQSELLAFIGAVKRTAQAFSREMEYPGDSVPGKD